MSRALPESLRVLLSLILADLLPWSHGFWITAAFMLARHTHDPAGQRAGAAHSAPKTLRQAVVEPFNEFMGHNGLHGALLVLAFRRLIQRFLRRKNGTGWIDQGIRVTGWQTARYLVSNIA